MSKLKLNISGKDSERLLSFIRNVVIFEKMNVRLELGDNVKKIPESVLTLKVRGSDRSYLIDEIEELIVGFEEDGRDIDVRWKLKEDEEK